VSRRLRAVAFLLMALMAAALAAAIADGYGSRLARGYGALQPVVVAGAELRGGEALGPEQVASALEVRHIPQRFVPPGALSVPGEALGLVPRAPVPSGSYLLAGQLRPPGRPRSTGLAPRLHPVEISISGAEALLAAGPLPTGAKVDVVVTSEPGSSVTGRVYVAAASVPLLSLGPGADGPEGLSSATLGLTRRQALRLIAAESFARRLTLLPEG
jgi:Flp pilus assembly protein CpaB